MSLALVLVILQQGSVAQDQPHATKPPTVGDQLFEATNRERTKEGLPIFVRNAELTKVAEQLAADMADRNVLEHQDHLGRQLSERVELFNYTNWTGIAENIACGQRTVDQVIESWLKSPGHRRNMLNESYTELGVACVAKNGRNYWVQDFGVRGR